MLSLLLTALTRCSRPLLTLATRSTGQAQRSVRFIASGRILEDRPHSPDRLATGRGDEKDGAESDQVLH